MFFFTVFGAGNDAPPAESENLVGAIVGCFVDGVNQPLWGKYGGGDDGCLEMPGMWSGVKVVLFEL